MKILFIPSWFPTEENPISGIFFKEQAKALQKNGHTVIVVVINKLWSLKKIFHYKKLNYVNKSTEDGLFIYEYSGYNYFPRLHSLTKHIFNYRLNYLYKRIIKDFGKPDILHAHSSLWGGYAAAKLKKRTGIPLVLTEHTTWIGRGLIRKEHLSQIRYAFDSANYLIAVGPSLKKAMQQYTSKDIDIVPNCIDINKFSFKLKNNNGESPFRFFSLGLLTKIKGMDLLIKAFSNLKNKNSVLYIGGDGVERIQLEALVNQLNLNSRVHFLGNLSREKVAEQMSLCDSFVLASRYETFGIVYIEALASGKPIIATDCGGPSIIVNKDNGYLVPVDDVHSLSESMELMITEYEKFNPDFIRQDCINRFSEQAIVKKLNSIYKDLLGNEI